MNKSMVRYLLAKLLLIEASLMLVPVIVAFIYHENRCSVLDTLVFLWSTTICTFRTNSKYH